MKIYIVASNKYSHVCKLNVHYLHKYWPGQDITVVGYDGLEKYTFENAEKIVIGKQDDFGTSWSTGLIPFFEQVPEDYFVVLIEDLILLNNVDPERVSNLENLIKNNEAQKAIIGGGLPLQQTTVLDENTLVFDQSVNYRATLHPAIWRKDYFMKFLRPGLSIWDFEVGNNEAAKFDGATIITDNYQYPAQQHPFSHLNLYSRGNIMISQELQIIDDQPSKKYFTKDDLAYILEEMKNA